MKLKKVLKKLVNVMAMECSAPAGEWSGEWDKPEYRWPMYGGYKCTLELGKTYHILKEDGTRCIGEYIGRGDSRYGGGSVMLIRGEEVAFRRGSKARYYTTPISTPPTPPELSQQRMKDRNLLDRLEDVLPKVEAYYAKRSNFTEKN